MPLPTAWKITGRTSDPLRRRMRAKNSPSAKICRVPIDKPCGLCSAVKSTAVATTPTTGPAFLLVPGAPVALGCVRDEPPRQQLVEDNQSSEDGTEGQGVSDRGRLQPQSSTPVQTHPHPADQRAGDQSRRGDCNLNEVVHRTTAGLRRSGRTAAPRSCGGRAPIARRGRPKERTRGSPPC